jgi:hypothetical protein
MSVFETAVSFVRTAVSFVPPRVIFIDVRSRAPFVSFP